MIHNKTKRSNQGTIGDTSSVDQMSLPTKYRRALSNPLTKLVNKKQEDYEMKMTRSFPAELLYRSKDISTQHHIDDRLPKLVLEALALPRKRDSDVVSSTQSKSISKIQTYSAPTMTKASRNKLRRRIKKELSMETPELTKSESTYQEPIMPIDEYPLYRIINDAVGDLAGLMSTSILKKRIKGHEQEQLLTKKLSDQMSGEDSSTVLSQETDLTTSQTNLISKGLNIVSKPIPSQIGGYLKKRCSLWRFQNKGRLSMPTSMSVNVSSEMKDDSGQDNKIPTDEDDTHVQYQPNNNVNLVKKLLEECTPKNIIYRNIRRNMFPYRINPKDFPDIHMSQLNKSRRFLQSLTGHDKVMLNMRPSMGKIHSLLVHKKLKEVEISQKKLEDHETKRLRQLQVQGLVNQNYDETEGATDNSKLSEKPHITYTSKRPIFNENPHAYSYRCMIKQFDRNLKLKDVEEEDVASIGDVSFLSSSSSYNRNLADLENAESNLLKSFDDHASPANSGVMRNQPCLKYMLTLNQLLYQLDREHKLTTIYESSEPLMCNAELKSMKKSIAKEVDKDSDQ